MMGLLPYFIHLGILIGVYIILVLSLNLAMGGSGLINLGHIALAGIGAYTAVLLAMKITGLPFLVTLFAGGIVAAGVGYILSLPAGRIRGDYFALMTLGFMFVALAIFLNWQNLTRGALGIPGIPRPDFLTTPLNYFIFTWLVVLLSYFFIRRVSESPFGRVMAATRDDERAAQVLGKNTVRVKSLTLSISAFFAGIGGALLVFYIQFIDPMSFYLTELILVLAALLVGGIASTRGSILGVVVLFLLLEPLRFLPLPPSLLGALRQGFFSLLLILVIIYRPRGFLGKIDLS